MAARTEREIVELAAKAIGLPGEWSIGHRVFHIAMHLRGTSEDAAVARAQFGLASGRIWWAPRHDDGDALRLAVALQIDVGFHNTNGHVRAHPRHREILYVSEDYHAHVDVYAATRLAILRAAAEIGAAMP